MAELKALVIAAPDPATDGAVRWRCLDLREQITLILEPATHRDLAWLTRSIESLRRRSTKGFSANC